MSEQPADFGTFRRGAYYWRWWWLVGAGFNIGCAVSQGGWLFRTFMLVMAAWMFVPYRDASYASHTDGTAP